MRSNRAHLHSHVVRFKNILVVFWLNDLLALMLNFQTPGGVSPFSGLCSHAAQCASQDVRYYIKNLGGRGALFAAGVFRHIINRIYRIVGGLWSGVSV